MKRIIAATWLVLWLATGARAQVVNPGNGSITYVPATSGTSILKGNGSGGFANAVSGTDYAPATTGSSILKGSSGGFAPATAGSDYAPATSGSSILKGNGSGGFSSATSGADYAPATSGSAILKGNGSGGFSNAASGTDYAPATSGTSLLKGNNSGGFANAASGTDYAPATSGSAILKGNGSGGFSAATAGTDYAAAPTGSANTPLLNNGSGGFTNGTLSGNTTTLATTTGALTNNHYLKADASGNLKDGGTGTTDLTSYSGGVGITGNTNASGTDSLNNVNWNKWVDPRTYGAVCDGTTDDTSAFVSALTANHAVAIPQGLVCVIASHLTISGVNGNTIFGQGRKETGPSDSTPKTGLKFTGTPGTCSGGTGGLLNINGAYSVEFRNMDIWFDQPTTDPTKCEIYIYNSARWKFEGVHITDPGSVGNNTLCTMASTPYACCTGNGTGTCNVANLSVNTTAFQMEQSDEGTLDNNIVDNGFARIIYSPDTSSPKSFMNLDRFTHNRFSYPAVQYAYLPQIDIESGFVGGVPQNIKIDHNVFEQAPNSILMSHGGFGIEITNNYMADGFGMTGAWQMNHSYTPSFNTSTRATGGCVEAAVSGTNYEFCNTQATTSCTSGGMTPSWSATLGASVSDNQCTWINEGRAIGVELSATSASVHDNLFGISGLVDLKLGTGDFATSVFGNFFNYGFADEIQAMGDAVNLGTNYFSADSSHPVPNTAAFVRVGVKSICTGAGTSQSSANELGCTGSNACSVSNWVANTGYSVGNLVIDSNGNTQEVTACAGTCTSANPGPPTWSKVIGGTTADNAGMNQVTWTLEIYNSPCSSANNNLDGQTFQDNSTNSAPYFKFSDGSSGRAVFDTNRYPSSRLSDVSNGGSGGAWDITDPAQAVSVTHTRVANLANLLACGTLTEGLLQTAKNCNASCSAGGTCTAGGSNHCQLYCNGSASVETGR